MANTKKYVSLEKLGLYDDKIKALINTKDGEMLDSAKAYADSLAKNYESAGSIATAQAALQKNIATAQAAADKAQGEVDALELVVGTLPEGSTSVVEYVNKKTEGIATDTALGELQNAVDAVEADVATIKGDYLKAADKTELNDAITAEANRAKGIEGGLETRLAAVEADYLKAADKTKLQGNIDDVAGDVADIAADYLKAADKTELNNAIALKADQTYVDEKVEALMEADESLQNQINTIMNNPDAEGAINSINEFSAWVAEHGTIADGMRTDINKNKDDIAAMDTAYKAADTALAGRLAVLEAIDHDAYVDADDALKAELNGEIAKKADADALADAVEALEGADSAMAGRLDAIEAQLGDGEGSVADMVADAKQEAIDAAASAADAKDEVILAAAKKYADDEDAKIEATIATLQSVVDGKAASSDLTALAGRVTTVEGKVGTLETEMDAVEALAAANKAAHEANAAAIALKASQADLEAVSGRVTTLETWHSNFVECSQEDINGLFA